tara:strand:+ start:745 stop:1275 length:531 start_codon:yes stop_codon:yes gene_type:complete
VVEYKNYMKNICYIIVVFLFLSSPVKTEENKKFFGTHELNFFSGIFDFSDDKKKSTIFGIQHQDENLIRDSFLGTLSPITGLMFTADNTAYIYTGVQAQYKIGNLNIVPSFTPGYYNQGDGKDLGFPIEFKSELQLSFDVLNNTELGFSYNHLSNASLGDKNPGANSYMFNFLKSF